MFFLTLKSKALINHITTKVLFYPLCFISYYDQMKLTVSIETFLINYPTVVTHFTLGVNSISTSP